MSRSVREVIGGVLNDIVVHVLSLWKLVGLWHRLLTRLLVTGYTCIYSNSSNPSRISDSHSFWCSYCPFNWAWSSWVACFYESARCCPSSCPLSLCNLIIEFLIVCNWYNILKYSLDPVEEQSHSVNGSETGYPSDFYLV